MTMFDAFGALLAMYFMGGVFIIVMKWIDDVYNLKIFRFFIIFMIVLIALMTTFVCALFFIQCFGNA